MHHKTPEHALKSQLGKVILDETILEGASVCSSILIEQFQNNNGFNTGQENTCPSSSHMGSSIPAFRDMYLHFIV